jgi:hypothetical protein
VVGRPCRARAVPSTATSAALEHVRRARDTAAVVHGPPARTELFADNPGPPDRVLGRRECSHRVLSAAVVVSPGPGIETIAKFVAIRSPVPFVGIIVSITAIREQINPSCVTGSARTTSDRALTWR